MFLFIGTYTSGICAIIIGILWLIHTIKYKEKIRSPKSTFQPLMSAYMGSVGFILMGILIFVFGDKWI